MVDNKKKSVSSLNIEKLFYSLQGKKQKKFGYKLLALAGKSKVAKDVYKLLEKSRIDDHNRP